METLRERVKALRDRYAELTHNAMEEGDRPHAVNFKIVVNELDSILSAPSLAHEELRERLRPIISSLVPSSEAVDPALDRILALVEGVGGLRARSECPICGIDHQHGHNELDIERWSNHQLARWGYRCRIFSLNSKPTDDESIKRTIAWLNRMDREWKDAMGEAPSDAETALFVIAALRSSPSSAQDRMLPAGPKRYRAVIRDGNSGGIVEHPYDSVDYVEDPKGDVVMFSDLGSSSSVEPGLHLELADLLEAAQRARNILDAALALRPGKGDAT